MALAAGESCDLHLSHNPTVVGDSDGLISFSYSVATDTLGSSHSTNFIIDGHSEILDVTGCSAMKPSITSLNPGVISASNDFTKIYVDGFNFSVATRIEVGSLEVKNISFIFHGLL